MALTDKLSAIGDAIRAKTGKEEKLTLDQMPDEIAGISGGGGGGGASAPVLAPLTVTENGTYYPTYEAATVTWDENTEYDGTLDVDGIFLRYKKAANLTVPEDVSELENPEYCFAVTLPDGTVQSFPLSDLRLESADGIYLANDISFAVVWVKDATFVNMGYGASLEDNTVYVTDYLWLAHGYEYAGALLSLTAQGQKLDGFSSVTVGVNNEAIVGAWKFNTYEEYDTVIVDCPVDVKYNGEYAVNFSCVYNGEARNCVRFRYDLDDRTGGIQIAFFDADDNFYPLVANGGDVPYLEQNVSTIIDFGADPQVVPLLLKELMTKSATRQESPLPVLQEKTATENGEAIPDPGYGGLSKVIIRVPSLPKKFFSGQKNQVFANGKIGEIYQYLGETDSEFEHGALYILEGD